MYTFDVSCFEPHLADEQCGVLVQRDDVCGLRAVRLINRHDNPRQHFMILWSDVIAAGIDRNDVLGFIHTHPKGSLDNPSYYDIVHTQKRYINAVYHLGTRNITVYDRNGMIAVYHIDDDDNTRRVV